MSLNIKILFCCVAILSLFFSACKDDEEATVNYTDGFVSLIEQPESPVVVTESSSLQLKSSGVKPGDRLSMRSTENPAMEIPVEWGYQYLGKDENNKYTYDENVVIIQLEFDDRWTSGKWQIILQRDQERQIIYTVDCQVLKLKVEAGTTDAAVDLNDLYKGLIHIYADGWLGKNTDFYEFKNNQTNEIVTLPSDVDPNATPEPYEDVIVAFPRDTLPTGSYSFYVKRWAYSFRQKICDFDYFRIGFVNKDPITKGADGEYAFDIYLDEIITGDQIRVGYGNKGFQENLTAAKFNAQTHTYHVVVPTAHILNTTFSVTLRRNGANLSLGNKQIIVNE